MSCILCLLIAIFSASSPLVASASFVLLAHDFHFSVSRSRILEIIIILLTLFILIFTKSRALRSTSATIAWRSPTTGLFSLGLLALKAGVSSLRIS